MKLSFTQFGCLLSALFALTSQVDASAAPAPAHVQFNRDVRPILSENCFQCHGADANKRKSKMRLDIRESALEKKAFVPGKPDHSELVRRLFSSDPEVQMPPPESNRHLSAPQKEILRAWIQDGALYEKHWAFIPPMSPPLPAVKQTAWPRNPLDQFILARLEAESLLPSTEAATEKLIRRASLDLIGLPPTPAQTKAWSRAVDPLAAAVDELLASPRFGERMASDWMDVARYADTHGFNNDSLRSMWRWRDWVIDAFNRNLPYDQFITEQLAGDLLKKPSLNQLIATGFNRNHGINSEGGIIDEEYRVEYVVDRVQTASLAWLGLTVGCGRCHDHKFDPVTQKDFYRLFAFFNNVDEWGEDGRVANASPTIPSPTAAQQDLMEQRRRQMEAAEKIMNRLLGAQNWSGIKLEDVLSVSPARDPFVATNNVIDLDLMSWKSPATTISNLAAGKLFHIKGPFSTAAGPNKSAGIALDGETELKTDGLPNADTAKGWAFAAWVRRETEAPGPLLSTMNFGVPPSSGSYGQGTELRLTESGAVEVRIAQHWPAYSVNVVTRDRIQPLEWRHVLITYDGSTKAQGVRVFVDGRECDFAVLHDDLTGGQGVSGETRLGASGEKGVSRFAGKLAGIHLAARPVATELLAVWSRSEALQFAARTRPKDRRVDQTEHLRQSWLARYNSQYAEEAASFQAARAALIRLEREAPTTMVMRELTKPRPSFVLFRGQYDQPREPVTPGVPEFLLPFPETAPQNRLGLANWLTDPRQPLTARVVVNRFWQSIFGTGIVKSVEDFGSQSEWPSHPELLDWLAREFIASGWDVKHLLKLIVTSATYRQDSRSTPELNERDPENRLLARGPRQRLTAEMIRDQALALSGLLQNPIGGPPVFPYQPANLYKGIIVAADYPGTSYMESQGADLYRRSLYTFWKRTVPQPTLATFDAPDREVCVARRLKTNTPLHALALMNDTIQLEAARKLAERMLTEGGTAMESRLVLAFELATARRPKPAERDALTTLLNRRLAHYRAHPDAANAFLSVGGSTVDGLLNPIELAAYANVASLILNLDETITRN